MVDENIVEDGKMPYPRTFSEEIKEGEYNFTVTLFEVENAAIVIFNEKGRMRLGTLAVAMPHFEGGPCISSALLGERNMIITKVLAEQLSTHFNRIVLVSTHLKEIKGDLVGSVLMRLAQKLLNKVKEN